MNKLFYLAVGLCLISGTTHAESGDTLGGTVNDVTTGLTGTLAQTLLLLDTSTGALLGVDAGLDGLAETVETTGQGAGGSAETLLDGLTGDAGLDAALGATLTQLPSGDGGLVLPGLGALPEDAVADTSLPLPGLDALPMRGVLAAREDDPSLPGVRTLPLPGLDALPIPVR